MFSEKTTIVTLHSYDELGRYNCSLEYLWVVGTGIAASSTLKKPLKDKVGFVSVWNGSAWEYQENHLGKTIYSTETKEPKTVDCIGEIEQGWTLLEPIQFGVWDGSAWVDNRTPEQIAEYGRSLMPTLSPIEFDIKLVNTGLYDRVQDLIQADIKLKIAYTRATFFSRLDPFISQASGTLGLTPEQVDAMWSS